MDIQARLRQRSAEYEGTEGIWYIEDMQGKVICSSPHVRPVKRGKGYYVSFYHDSYRHWANYVWQDEPFWAKRTGTYQYVTTNAYNRNPGAQVRLNKAIRINARRLKGPY